MYDPANVVMGKDTSYKALEIELPDSFDAISAKLNRFSDEYRYLYRLLSWSNLEYKQEIYERLEKGLNHQEAFELQNYLLCNQKLINRELLSDSEWMTRWAVELAVSLDDWRDERLQKKYE